MQQSDRLIIIGKITKTHGVHGAVCIKPFVESRYFFETGANIIVNDITYKIISSFVKNIGFVVKLNEITNIESAEQLCGSYAFTNRSSFKQIEKNSFYFCDLISLPVFDQNGNKIGVVINVADYGAGTFLEIKTNNNKIATIQFNKKSVISVLDKIVININTLII